MKKCWIGVALVLSSVCSSAWAEEPAAGSADPKRAKALLLMEMTGAGELGVQVLNQMLPNLKAMVPKAPESFWQEFMTEVRPESLVELIVPVYTKHFDESDLDELIRFYSTPVGRKMIEKTPAIAADSMTAGQQWGTEIAQRALERLKAAGLLSEK
jgi:uncharacterized protein